MGVYEQIDVPADSAGLVADASMERRMPPLQLREHGSQVRYRERQFCGARAAIAQRSGNVDGDGCGAGRHRFIGGDINPLRTRVHFFLVRWALPERSLVATHQGWMRGEGEGGRTFRYAINSPAYECE